MRPANNQTAPSRGSGHERFMGVALRLAQQHLGITWPNPSVGAVIVKDGQIIAQGITQRGGRPHAETQALEQAGAQAKGATLYVTLEPCSHHGKTPPCVDAICAAGITTVVIGCKDANPLISGKGMESLRKAGIEVVEKICEAEALLINRGFFSTLTRKRPFIALKLATSLDGKMATSSRQSQWITGEKSRFQAHLLRSRYDAIATGIGTVLADDPLLTCRLPGMEDRSPVRVVFDRKGRLPPQSKLAKTSNDIPVWVMTSPLEDAVKELAQRGVTRLLVEAGAKLSTAFLQSGLVDRMYWFRAPVVIGDDGLAAAGDGFPAELEKLQRWKLVEHRQLDSDTLSILECLPASSAA
jgi:diaminohydroxyphosphoribosylaminopyrimidine deaminase / 5-amino-6-(5-phosphoribosylamino)uracil reductase